MTVRTAVVVAAIACSTAFTACTKANAPGAQPPSEAEVRAFVDKTERTLDDLGVKLNRASWVQETYITDDTEALAAKALSDYTAAVTTLALEARRFESL